MKERIESGIVLTFLRLFLLFILGSVLLIPVQVHANFLLTTIHVDPLMSCARPGETFNISLRIDHAMDVFTWQVKIGYDSLVLRFVDATLPPDHFLEGRPQGTSQLQVYELGQTVLLGCTILGEYLGMFGSGTLATVEFEVLGTAECVLRIEEDPEQTFLLDHMARGRSRTTRDGFFISTELLPYYDLSVALISSYSSLLTDHSTLLDDHNSLLADYNTLTTSFNTLTISHSSLVANYTNLQNSYDALTRDLDTATNLNYLFVATAIAFIAATGYLAIRKSRGKQHPKTT